MCKLEKMGAISARICGACEDVAMSFLFSALARLVLGCEMEGVVVLSSLPFSSCACCTSGQPTKLPVTFSSSVPGVGGYCLRST